MGIEKFEVDKKYRCMEYGGEGMYCGCDIIKGQEFVVRRIEDHQVITEDVTYNRKEGDWIIYDGHDNTTLEDFELVEENSDVPEINNSSQDLPLDIGVRVLQPKDKDISTDFIQATLEFANKHDLILMFSDEEIIVNFKDNDTEYKISCLEDLNKLIESNKTLQSFERNQ